MVNRDGQRSQGFGYEDLLVPFNPTAESILRERHSPAEGRARQGVENSPAKPTPNAIGWSWLGVRAEKCISVNDDKRALSADYPNCLAGNAEEQFAEERKCISVGDLARTMTRLAYSEFLTWWT